MTKFVQFIKLFINMKISTNIEINDNLLSKKWEWHNVRCIVLMKHDGHGGNKHGDGES